MMQRYYRAARGVRQINTILLVTIRAALFPDTNKETPLVINEQFQKRGQLLEARHENVFSEDPGAIFESVLLLQQNPELKARSAATLRAMWRTQRSLIRGSGAIRATGICSWKFCVSLGG